MERRERQVQGTQSWSVGHGNGVGAEARFVGDVNGDGVDDVATRYTASIYPPRIAVRIYSGADTSVLADIDLGPWLLHGFDGMGDANADGYADVVLAHFVAAETVHVYSVQPVTPASVRFLGMGCGGGFQPVLHLGDALPLVGTTPMLALWGAPPSASGILLVGPAVSPTAVLSGGCQWFVNAVSMVSVSNFTTSSAGSWALPLPIDPRIDRAGFRVALQVAFVQGGAVSTVSNALELVTGS